MQVGPVNIRLDPGADLQFVAMISTSASNFEFWLEQRSTYGEERLPRINAIRDASDTPAR